MSKVLVLLLVGVLIALASAAPVEEQADLAPAEQFYGGYGGYGGFGYRPFGYGGYGYGHRHYGFGYRPYGLGYGGFGGFGGFYG